MRASLIRNPIQAFAPTRIESVTTLDTTGIQAIRISADAQYQINGTGTEATMPAGVTAIASNVSSIVFSAATVVEIM